MSNPPQPPATRRGRAPAAVALIALAASVAGCVAGPGPAPSASPTRTGTAVAASGAAKAESRLALITDFGTCDPGEQWAADTVRSWDVEAIITAGDNSQNHTGCVPYTESVWGFYPRGADGSGEPILWPTLGNHDYDDRGAGLDAYRRAFPYLSKDADAAQRWYSQSLGHVRLFSVDSGDLAKDDEEKQRVWLQTSLTASRAADPSVWNLVVFHRPAYTSGVHPPNVEMRPQPEGRWDLREWGADLVVSGHQHIYEDVIADGLHYVTAGISAGLVERECPVDRVPGSRVCLNGTGVIQLLATPDQLTLEYRQRSPESDAAQVTDTIRLTR